MINYVQIRGSNDESYLDTTSYLRRIACTEFSKMFELFCCKALVLSNWNYKKLNLH